ncbi:MAG: thioredoxin family protein [Deltaproteobacteria bacterium]|nr:thioredoxin family protein [Deltaproteobacteria bacterium]
MSVTASTMLALGTKAPDFELADGSGALVRLNDFKDAPALLVIFLCNHCPYVKHIRFKLAEVADEYITKGVAIVGINANDAVKYPEDTPDKMVEEVRKTGYIFPYLYDASQQVAKAYRAACTPEFYLFDRDRRLVYRGQFDDSRPGNAHPITGSDLKAAMDAVLQNRVVSIDQKPGIGCNIKWRPGNEPDYFQ